MVGMQDERRWIVATCVAAVSAIASYLGAELVMAGEVGPAQDDGWIYFSAARSFVEGDWFSYPGHEGPVAAITGPLWSFVLAIAMSVGGASAVTAKVVGLAMYGAVLRATWFLAHTATDDRRLAWIATLVVAVTGRILWSSLSGMEGGLGTALVLTGMAMHLRQRDAPLRRWLPAAVVLTAAGWARPENHAFLLIAALHRRSLFALAAATALAALFPLYHLGVYGIAAPLPLFAKALPDAPWSVLRDRGALAGLGALLAAMVQQVGSVLGLLVSFVPFLVPGFLTGWREGRRARNGVGFLVASLVGFTLVRSALGAQPAVTQQARYFIQLWPLFLIVCLHGLDFARRGRGLPIAILVALAAAFVLDPRLASYQAFDFVGPDSPFGPERLVVALFWLPVALAISIALAGWFSRGATGRAGTPPVAIIAAWLALSLAVGAHHHGSGVRDTFDLNVRMARNVNAETRPGELIACHDIGALGWFADRPLLDLVGLANPEVTFHPLHHDLGRWFGAILSTHRPRWLCVTDTMLGNLNPNAAPVPGLASLREVERARVHSEVNITVAGSRYHLIELTWQP
ncbi:MAG: hypothetical protein HZB39_20750 [Planctomycetes bacterium]|nr:hypothetical protein [Planctomycetota bacterium]